jgi:molybdate transport system substrate-binding protein
VFVKAVTSGKEDLVMNRFSLIHQFLVRPADKRVGKWYTIMGIRRLSLTVAIVSGLAGAVATSGYAQTEPLTVGAPPSLRPVLSEILPMFEKEYGASVNVVYTASKTLSRQIEQGAPIDVFLAAGVDEVEHLHKKGLTLYGGPRIYAQTSLVLVMSTDPQATLVSFHDALPNRTTRIALGDPQTSSLGDITARALTKLNPTYRNRSQILYARHSEDIINLIHAGKADVGLVYRVDAINGGQVRISDETPAGKYVPVQFGQAVVWTCRETARGIAKEFSDFLMSPRIQKLLIKYGFDPVPSNG